MPGAPDIGFGDQLRALGHPRHPQPRLGQPARAGRVIILEDRPRFGMDDDRHAERRRDRVDGDVVVRRPDPAGREQIVVARAQRVHRLADALAGRPARSALRRAGCPDR